MLADKSAEAAQLEEYVLSTVAADVFLNKVRERTMILSTSR
jgi:hypothetical protein